MNFLKLSKKLVRQGDSFISEKGVKNFHKFSSALLADSAIHEAYNFQEIVSAIFLEEKQHYQHLEFSDLPVTVFRGDHCFIDVYFWRRRPTMIHNHHFSGAFMCLEGMNDDFEFTYKKTRKLGTFNDLGEVELKRKRPLRPGDVVPIDLLDRFIHQNHHHADLTVNLCFRTKEVSKKNISSYLYSGLRTEKNPAMLGRVHRLRRVLDLGEVEFKKLELSTDDAITFLLQYSGAETSNKQFNGFLEFLDRKIKKDLKLDVPELLARHDQILNEIENEYD